MKKFLWLLFSLIITVVRPDTLTAAPLTPEDFAREPAVWSMQISPDGNTLGWIARARGMTTLYFLDLKTDKVNWLSPNSLSASTSKKREISAFRWVSNNRVMFETGSRGAFSSEAERHFALGIGAVDRDGKNWMGLTGDTLSQEQKRSRWGVFWPHGYVGPLFEKQPDMVYLVNTSLGGEKGSQRESQPLLFAMNTRTGKYKALTDTPRVASAWIMDRQDQVRMAIATIGTGWTTSSRAADDFPWQTLPDLSSPGGNLYPLGFTSEADIIYVAKLTKMGTWGVFHYDLNSGKLADMVVENPDFDIINPHDNPSGVGLIYARGKHRVIGVRYMADWLLTAWFDKEFAEVQVAVDQALPQTNNLLMDWSDDGQKILVQARTEQSLGEVYLLDRSAHTFRKLGPAMPWIKPEEMAQVFPIKFKARDGLELRGYLTYPPGKERKNLPMVMYPHGGPFVRDTMNYDPVVQFLASRGYAVLQVNYRGSTGFGESFYLAGWHEVGKKIQDDITDGVKAMIAGGVADPHRIAILGMSYGGYSALWALENTPDLYRCGISVAGVTDYVALIGAEHQKIRLGSYDHIPWQVYAAWKQKVGDPATDEEALKAISPIYHVDKIRAPVLVVQGTQDGIVPETQARHFISELKNHHIPYEDWLVKWEGHPYFVPDNQAKLYERIEAFLAKHMQ